MSIGKCECLDADIKTYLEGALIHYIREMMKNIEVFTKAAQEYKTVNPQLSKHYSLLVGSENDFIEKIQAAKVSILELPTCEAKSGNPVNVEKIA